MRVTRMARMARALCALLLGLLPCTQASAQAEAYPNRPIRFIVPFPPGGTTDILARAIGQKMAENWGQQVVIDNRPGASGNIGIELATKAAPDGYTIVMGSAQTLVINPYLFRTLPYDILRDLAPVSLAASVPNVLVVNLEVPIRSIADLVAQAKANPGKLNYASTSSGGSPHLSGVMLANLAGIDIVHIPYKGSAPALTDVMGGQVQMFFDNLPSSMPFIKAGKLRAVAVTTAKRAPELPDVPTIAEQGYPGFETAGWFGIMVRAGTPKDIVNKLSAEIQRILRLPDVRERLAAQGAELVGNTPDEFLAHLKREMPKWDRAVKDSGAKAD
jgi:tripartite-type tricarboxylate transporter receptor subunit TctC